MIGNVSDWLSYAGGALIKVADSAGSTVKFILLINVKMLMVLIMVVTNMLYFTLNMRGS